MVNRIASGRPANFAATVAAGQAQRQKVADVLVAIAATPAAPAAAVAKALVEAAPTAKKLAEPAPAPAPRAKPYWVLHLLALAFFLYALYAGHAAMERQREEMLAAVQAQWARDEAQVAMLGTCLDAQRAQHEHSALFGAFPGTLSLLNGLAVPNVASPEEFIRQTWTMISTVVAKTNPVTGRNAMSMISNNLASVVSAMDAQAVNNEVRNAADKYRKVLASGYRCDRLYDDLPAREICKEQRAKLCDTLNVLVQKHAACGGSWEVNTHGMETVCYRPLSFPTKEVAVV